MIIDDHTRLLAEKLTEMKQRAGRSYGALAHRTRISTSTLQRYCTGQTVPPEFEPLERFAKVCGADQETLTELGLLWRNAKGDQTGPETFAPGGNPEPARIRKVPLVAVVLSVAGLALAGIVWFAVGGGAPAPVATSAPAQAPAGFPGAVSLVNARVLPSEGTRYVADVANWSEDEGAEVHLWKWRTDVENDIRNQLWLPEPARPSGTRYRNVLSNRCLAREGARPVQSGCTDSPDQAWSFDDRGRLVSLADHLCLDTKEHRVSEGEALLLALYSDALTQRWEAVARPS